MRAAYAVRSGGLYVSRKDPHRFEVASRGGAAASGRFDYRVVARRKDDVGKRLEKITMADESKLKHPTKPADAPGAPERPTPAAPRP